MVDVPTREEFDLLTLKVESQTKEEIPDTVKQAFIIVINYLAQYLGV